MIIKTKIPFFVSLLFISIFSVSNVSAATTTEIKHTTPAPKQITTPTTKVRQISKPVIKRTTVSTPKLISTPKKISPQTKKSKKITSKPTVNKISIKH